MSRCCFWPWAGGWQFPPPRAPRVRGRRKGGTLRTGWREDCLPVTGRGREAAPFHLSLSRNSLLLHPNLRPVPCVDLGVCINLRNSQKFIQKPTDQEISIKMYPCLEIPEHASSARERARLRGILRSLTEMSAIKNYKTERERSHHDGNTVSK